MPPSTVDTVKLVVGGNEYRDWYEVELDSDVFSAADAFNVRAKHPGPKYIGAFREGMNLDVYVGDDRQMAGFLDTVTEGGTRKRTTLTLAGRDKGAYLMDTEAESLKLTDHKFQTLVEKIIRPGWGIRRVVISNDANRAKLLGKKARKSKAGKSVAGSPWNDVARATSRIDTGQRIAQILDERTRELGLIWWITAEGDLFIGRPNYNQNTAFQFLCYATGSARARYNNVESWERERSITDRFSHLTIVGQGSTASSLFKTKVTAKEAKFKATVTDPDLVARGIDRKVILTYSDVLNGKQARDRAEWEMGKRRLSADTLRVTATGWRQDGLLFAVDTLAHVVIEEAAIDGLYWISQRRFRGSRGKNRTDLTLHLPRVYLP